MALLWRHNGAMASQIISLTIVCSIVHLGTDQRKHQSSTWLAFVRGIYRWLVNSPHKGPVTRKMFPFNDVIIGVWYWRDLQDSATDVVFHHSLSNSIVMATANINTGHTRLETSDSGGEWCGIRNELVDPRELFPFSSLTPGRYGSNHERRIFKFDAQNSS